MAVSILNVLHDQVIAWLTQKLITEIPADDLTRVGLVHSGKFRDDPTRNAENILIHFNDPFDEQCRHALATWYENADVSSDGPTWQIGGGRLFWRKFTAELKIFYMKSASWAVARENAHVILSRAEWALENMPVPGVADDFGEWCISPPVVTDSRTKEGGGEPDYICKGYIHFQVRTMKEH